MVRREYTVTYAYHKDAACAQMHCKTETVTVDVPTSDLDPFGKFTRDGEIAIAIHDQLTKDHPYYYEIAVLNFWYKASR